MEITATEIAFLALVLFFGLLIYLKVPAMVTGGLDKQRQAIADELHAARKLREEAEKALADYEAKRAAAETEARAIVDAAKEQAAAVAEETRQSMMAAMARREKQAEDRIKSAETKATDEVRAAAAEAAVAAAEKLIRASMSDKSQSALVASGTSDLKRNFG
ncbi:MAG: ATPase [Hyphomonadaceae bacterium]|jgi:F-type H+-transporting ATPase subunit b|nr:ATPase [Hyphomonadaceae bacterium]